MKLRADRSVVADGDALAAALKRADLVNERSGVLAETFAETSPDNPFLDVNWRDRVAKS